MWNELLQNHMIIWSKLLKSSLHKGLRKDILQYRMEGMIMVQDSIVWEPKGSMKYVASSCSGRIAKTWKGLLVVYDPYIITVFQIHYGTQG